MSYDHLVGDVIEWLVHESLEALSPPDLFVGMCERLHQIGVPIDRGNVAYTTLHPMIEAETARWRPGEPLETIQHDHDASEREDWQQSPLRYVTENLIPLFRRRLTGPDAILDYPLLVELRDEGYTDYLIQATALAMTSTSENQPVMPGMAVTWATRAPDGFSDAAIAALTRIHSRFALAIKTSMQASILGNVAATYLGPIAAERVLSGQIRRGDGAEISAVVWYSDMRDSTHLSESMARADYLALLNTYFECTAGAVLAHGGNVLDFIGDAVLAVFHTDAAGLEAAARAATAATQTALANRDEALGANPELPLSFGIAVTAGEVMFGNIGVKERLRFSVIGPTVNEAARIEALTKTLDAPALATAEIASAMPESWCDAGQHVLRGKADPVALWQIATNSN